MTQTIELPLWLLLLVALLAGWALLDRLLVPGVRWFFRHRVNLVIDELSRRLDVEIPSFALTRRRVLIDRLVYDPKVLDAVAAFCEAEDTPREVVMARIARYANEIVPSFNAYIYFRFGSWMSKRLARLLYRVRLGYVDEEGLAGVDRKASVVLVMNHRSNMDYILVAYLALNRTALSYAVGEWARVWPIQQLVRSMGAYFVRRGSDDPLYRRVLERYVQMAVEGGVVQAVFPEGGLSRDGRLRKPKIGLFDYMLRGFDPEGERDLVFIPVALNYDRVLEDRTLLLMDRSRTGTEHPKRGLRAIMTTLRFALHNFWLMLRGRWHRFGYACANFGTPISMRSYLADREWDFRDLDREERGREVGALAGELMAQIGRLMPALPVSIVSSVMLTAGDQVVTREWIQERARRLMADLERRGAQVYVPRNDRGYAVKVGLRMLTLRHLVVPEGQGYRSAPAERDLLAYYANALTTGEEY